MILTQTEINKKVLRLEKNAILNSAVAKKSSSVAADTDITCPVIRGGTKLSQTLTLHGSQVTGAGNQGALILNPAGGRIGIGATPGASTATVVIGNNNTAVASLTVCMVNTTSSNTINQLLFSESETNNSAVALGSILVFGSTYGTTVDRNFIALHSASGGVSLRAGNTERLRIETNGRVIMSAAPTYADEAAATAGGLATGTMYKTSTGELRIKL